MQTPPLSLYIHMPWCEKKCPYCDFNSYPLGKQNITNDLYTPYINAVIKDLENQKELVKNRNIISIYIGGGTPSLPPPQIYEKLFNFIYKNFSISQIPEITIEVNPASTLEKNLLTLKSFGINRISMGVQSLHDTSLKALGRIHNRKIAIDAINAVANNFNNFNLDLMHALPFQTLKDSNNDLLELIKFKPTHISWYELTIEEDTYFRQNIPKGLPDDDLKDLIDEEGNAILCSHGYNHYEISAYSLPNRQSIHNSNYWRFGDYIAAGAGAMSKISYNNTITYSSRIADPKSYVTHINNNQSYQNNIVHNENELIFTYFLGRFRIFEAFNLKEFEAFTGLSLNSIEHIIQTLVKKEMITLSEDNIVTTTKKGRAFGNQMLYDLLP